MMNFTNELELKLFLHSQQNNRALLGMDNASYHYVLDEEDRLPIRKHELTPWLNQEGVSFPTRSSEVN